MSEAEGLREACDDLLGSLDASIAIVERIAAENLGVAALMRVHRGARARARRLLAGLPDLPVRDDDTEDLLRGVVRVDAPPLAATDAAIDAPVAAANVPVRPVLPDDEPGDEDDTAQGALRAQLRALREAIGDAESTEDDELFDDNEGDGPPPVPAAVPVTAAIDALVAFDEPELGYEPIEVEPLDEDDEGLPAVRGHATPAELSDDYVNFDGPLVELDEESGAGAAPSYVTYDEPAPPRAAPRRESPVAEGAPRALVEITEDAEPLSVASMALGSSALVEFDEPLVRVGDVKAPRAEDEGLFSGSGVAPTPNLARLPAASPPTQRVRGANPETFDLMPDVEETEVGLKPLPASATTTDLEAVDDDNSAGEVLLPSQVAAKLPARPMIVRPAARGGSSAAARVAAKTGAAPAEPTAVSGDARLLASATPADADATPGTAMGRAAVPPAKPAEPAVSPPAGAKSAARAQRPAPGSVPMIREGGEARPRGAAVQLNIGDQAGAPKVLGLDEEFEPLEMGEAEGDLPVGGGFQIQVEEYDDVYEEVEEEKPDVMPVPAPAPPPRVGPGKAEIRALLDDAHEAAKGGQNERAVDLYSDALDADPDNVEAHIGRGRLYLDLADYARAMSDFTVAEDIDEHSPEPQVAIGDLYFARKDYRKAIDYFSAALQMSPNHAMAFCRRGISHYYRKNYTEALDDLLRAQRIDNEIPNISTFVAMAKKKAPPTPMRR